MKSEWKEGERRKAKIKGRKEAGRMRKKKGIKENKKEEVIKRRTGKYKKRNKWRGNEKKSEEERLK